MCAWVCAAIAYQNKSARALPHCDAGAVVPNALTCGGSHANASGGVDSGSRAFACRWQSIAALNCARNTCMLPKECSACAMTCASVLPAITLGCSKSVQRCKARARRSGGESRHSKKLEMADSKSPCVANRRARAKISLRFTAASGIDPVDIKQGNNSKVSLGLEGCLCIQTV